MPTPPAPHNVIVPSWDWKHPLRKDTPRTFRTTLLLHIFHNPLRCSHSLAVASRMLQSGTSTEEKKKPFLTTLQLQARFFCSPIDLIQSCFTPGATTFFDVNQWTNIRHNKILHFNVPNRKKSRCYRSRSRMAEKNRTFLLESSLTDNDGSRGLPLSSSKRRRRQRSAVQCSKGAKSARKTVNFPL